MKLEVGRKKDQFAPEELQRGLHDHYSGDPLTALVERRAEELIESDFRIEDCFLALRLIVAWGGLNFANIDRIQKWITEHGREELKKCLQRSRLKALDGNFEASIKEITRIRGLGISYGSKVLRFLCPDHAAVYDSVIREDLPMPHSPLGYHDFVEGCMRMRDSMNSYEVQSSNQFTWKTVHIEMGIYKILKERREQGKNGGMGK